jgi:hypothetical protein
VIVDSTLGSAGYGLLGDARGEGRECREDVRIVYSSNECSISVEYGWMESPDARSFMVYYSFDI